MMVLGLGASLSVACCHPSSPPGFNRDFAFVSRGIDPSAPHCEETVRVSLASDTHAHYLYGGGGDLFQTSLADYFSASAIRVPQTDLYAPALQTAYFEHMTKSESVLLHLGDVVDASCTDELDTFLQVIKSSSVPWFLAPGNHDGFHFGAQDQGPDATWDSVCRGSSPLTKDLFLRGYLKALREQIKARREVAQNATDFPADGQGPQQWRFSGTGPALLQRAAWNIRDGAGQVDGRWSSYLVQELDLTGHVKDVSCADPAGGARPRVLAILLDTSSYSQGPGLLGPPVFGGTGSRGEISSDEQKIVSQWIAEARAENARIVLVGHHPSTAMGSDLQRLLTDSKAVLYLSSHDHDGKWMAAVGSDHRVVPELNIGSLITSPLEMRTVWLSKMTSGEEAGQLAVTSSLTRFDRNDRFASSLIKVCDEHGAGVEERDGDGPWEAAPGDADDYTSYRRIGWLEPEATMSKMLDVALASYGRLARFGHIKSGWPASPSLEGVKLQRVNTTDGRHHYGPSPLAAGAKTLKDKANLLRSLHAAIENAHTEPEQVRDQFERCQVYWSTQYEAAMARVPPPEDWTVILPKAPPK